MIRRIIHCYTVHFVTVSAKDGQLVPSQENTYEVESQRTLSEVKLLAKVNRIAKGAVITAVDHSEEIYQLSYDDFMKYATKVD